MEADEFSAAQIAFAEAARQFVDHAVARHADDETYSRLQREIEALTATLLRHPVRANSIPAFIREIQASAQREAGTFDWGQSFPDSAFSGTVNPASPNMDVEQDGDQVVGRVTCGRAFRGAPGRVHGGTVAGLIDDVMGALLPVIGVFAFTGELTVRYEAGCPIGTPLTIRAWSTGREGRKLYIEAEGTSGEGRFATARGTFIVVDLASMAGTAEQGG